MNNNSITKTFEVIRAFTDHQEQWGVNELARYLEVPPSSLHRILKTLREENILMVDELTKRYQIGEELIRLSSIVSSKTGIKQLAQSPLANLAEKIEESIYLGLYQPMHERLAFIECFHSTKNAVQYVLEIGRLQTLTKGASGTVILANLPMSKVSEIFDLEEISLEERELILEQIEFFHANDYLITNNEQNVDAMGIAAPIFAGSGNILGCVSCVIPSKVFDEKLLDFKVQNIMKTANDISSLLGYR